MEGVRIQPNITLDSFGIDDAALLILPGGYTRAEPVYVPLLEIVKECLDAPGVTVAAICGATTALAYTGVLNDRYHISNDREIGLDGYAEHKKKARHRLFPYIW
jgi:putative intracellular protease/amidase